MKTSMRYILSVATLVFASNVWADGSVVNCEVEGSGSYPAGDEFDGSASSIDGLFSLEWSHDAPGVSFETIDATLVNCLLNGTLQALFISDSGQGMVNGVPGYNFQIQMTDNRDAPTVVALTASITHQPTRRNEGVINFVSPRALTIPAEIEVTAGGSANGKVNLVLDDVICKYRGTGVAYAFDRCNSGNVAGDTIDVVEAKLKIKQADKSFSITSVEVVVSSETPPGPRDTYFITAFDDLNNVVLEFSSPLDDGDIDITILP